MQEVVSVERRHDGLKGQRGLIVVKTIGQVVGLGIRIAQRSEAEILLDVFQNASEIVSHVGNVGRLRVRRYDNLRYAKAILVAVDYG